MDIILRQEFCRWLLTRADENQTQSVSRFLQAKSGSEMEYLIFCHSNHQRVLCNVVNMFVMAIRGECGIPPLFPLVRYVCVCVSHTHQTLPARKAPPTPLQGADPLRLEFNDLKKI